MFLTFHFLRYMGDPDRHPIMMLCNTHAQHTHPMFMCYQLFVKTRKCFIRTYGAAPGKRSIPNNGPCVHCSVEATEGLSRHGAKGNWAPDTVQTASSSRLRLALPGLVTATTGETEGAFLL